MWLQGSGFHNVSVMNPGIGDHTVLTSVVDMGSVGGRQFIHLLAQLSRRTHTLRFRSPVERAQNSNVISNLLL